MNRNEVINKIRDLAPQLRERYGVVSATLFGSVARDHATDSSDIDLAVQFADGGTVDVMKLCGISGFLTPVLGVDVDVIALPAKRKDVGDAIKKEGVRAF